MSGRSEMGIGPRFQDETQYRRGGSPPPCEWARAVPGVRPATPGARVVALPAATATGGPGLWATIAGRRSERVFTQDALPLEDLSQLLWAIQGLTTGGQDPRFRATASAGARHPHETYLVVNRVTGVEPCLARYLVGEHALEVVREGNLGAACVEACLGQKFCATAQVVFAWGAVVDRCAEKYGERAYRYLYLDAGHLGAQLQLAAAALGLGSVNIGAFLDDEVSGLFGVDGEEEAVVYLAAVGRPAR
jgi:SagB-type dehydrogenase family enzyme